MNTEKNTEKPSCKVYCLRKKHKRLLFIKMI